jgi:hypothetical protein
LPFLIDLAYLAVGVQPEVDERAFLRRPCLPLSKRQSVMLADEGSVKDKRAL